MAAISNCFWTHFRACVRGVPDDKCRSHRCATGGASTPIPSAILRGFGSHCWHTGLVDPDGAGGAVARCLSTSVCCSRGVAALALEAALPRICALALVPHALPAPHGGLPGRMVGDERRAAGA